MDAAPSSSGYNDNEATLGQPPKGTATRRRRPQQSRSGGGSGAGGGGATAAADAGERTRGGGSGMQFSNESTQRRRGGMRAGGKRQPAGTGPERGRVAAAAGAGRSASETGIASRSKEASPVVDGTANAFGGADAAARRGREAQRRRGGRAAMGAATGVAVGDPGEAGPGQVVPGTPPRERFLRDLGGACSGHMGPQFGRNVLRSAGGGTSNILNWARLRCARQA